MRSSSSPRWLVILLAALVASVAHSAAAQQAQDAPTYPQDELDQLLAPIALYPDDLLTQILVASTYPYHGYYYRILLAQGPDAPGGAYDYVVGGRVIGGFAMVAYPARWSSSGVMTFIVNQDGVAYEKNFGPQTPGLAGKMTRFNPDASWQKVQP